MQEALEIWCRTSAATYRALVGVTLDAHQARVALGLCHHIKECVEPDTDRQLKSQKDKGLFTMSIYPTHSTVPYLEIMLIFILYTNMSARVIYCGYCIFSTLLSKCVHGKCTAVVNIL